MPITKQTARDVIDAANGRQVTVTTRPELDRATADLTRAQAVFTQAQAALEAAQARYAAAELAPATVWTGETAQFLDGASGTGITLSGAVRITGEDGPTDPTNVVLGLDQIAAIAEAGRADPNPLTQGNATHT